MKDINFKIPKGKVTAIVGMSGSGKTTLVKLLLGLYKVNSGEIKIGGLNINNIKKSAWRDKCGMVLQDGYIFSDTIASNIAESDDEIDTDKLLDAAINANIHDYIASLRMKYDSKIGAEHGISQGQKQRILIARAIYKNPAYLFFDEATNALDSKNELIIMKNLEKFFSGRTVVVVAHRLSTIKNADQIIVLKQGHLAEVGTHKQLVKNKGEYFNLVKDQLDLENG